MMITVQVIFQFLETLDGGNPDPAIQTLINKGWTINYV